MTIGGDSCDSAPSNCETVPLPEVGPVPELATYTNGAASAPPANANTAANTKPASSNTRRTCERTRLLSPVLIAPTRSHSSQIAPSANIQPPGLVRQSAYRLLLRTA